MRKGQEVQKYILLAQVQHHVVHAQSLAILAVGQHHALALSRSAACVQNVAQIVVRSLGLSAFVFSFEVRSVAGQLFLQKVIEIHRQVVFFVFHHLRVEYNDTFQRLCHLHHAERRVILLLFAYEEKTDVSIVNHVGNLRATAGGIKGDGHRANAVGAEIHEVSFGFVL